MNKIEEMAPEEKHLSILSKRLGEYQGDLKKRFMTSSKKNTIQDRIKDVVAGMDVLETKIAKRLKDEVKGKTDREIRDTVHDVARKTGADYIDIMKKLEKIMKEDEEGVETPQEEPQETPPPEVDDSGGADFSDLNVSPAVAKALDGLEGKFGIRPDFEHNGTPGFVSNSEDEWYKNMKADRKRMRFKSDGKIAQFMRKHPFQNLYIRNPNKKSDYMYPVNRKNRKRPMGRS